MTRLAFRVARGVSTALAVGGACLAFATPAHAVIHGPCTGMGYETPGKPDDIAGAKKASTAAGGGSVDFSKAIWHVHSWKDWLSGDGSADGDMASGEAFVDAFGQSIQVAGGSGSGATGHGGPINPFEIAKKLPGPLKNEPPARVISASGSATVDDQSQHMASGPCDGYIDIIFDDASPAGNAAGQAGLGMMGVGGLGLVGVGLRKAG